MAHLRLAVSISLMAFIYANTCKAQQTYPEDFDCSMRQLTLEFAMNIQPFLAKDKLQEIADALSGAQESVNKKCVTTPSFYNNNKEIPQHTLPPE